MWSLRPEHFRLIYSCLPQLEEQSAIVRYLDYMDRRIQRYIRAKLKLIKLLEEQKQAIIHQAVTGRIDVRTGKPYPAYKPSGVEWLGEVPERWEVKPICAFCSYISYGFTNPMPVADEGPYMLTANDIGNGIIRYETARHTSREAYEMLLTRKSRPRNGDVLVTKDGTLGRAAVADGTPTCINQSVALLQPKQGEMLPEYLATALQGHLYQEQMSLDAGGTTIRHIYITRLAKMRLAFPSILGQEIILDSLGCSLATNTRACSNTKREIDLLREYRTRLISDVVTGKLDVREAAANLPDELEEELPEDQEREEEADEDLEDEEQTEDEDGD